MDEKEIRKVQRELMAGSAAKGTAKTALSECLADCEEEQLQHIGMGNGLEVPKKLNQETCQELREKLEKLIPGKFAEELPSLLKDQRELLKLAAKAGGEPLEEIGFGPFSVLMGLGVLYLYEEEGQLRLAFPKQLMEIFYEAEKTLKPVWDHNDEMWTYAKALVNLYGVYDDNWFCQVWNQHHKEKIPPEEGRGYLSSLWNLQYYCWYSDGFAVASYFESEEILDAFLDVTEDCPYYMPTKRDIAYYFEHEWDEDSPYLERIKVLLEKKMAEKPEEKFLLDHVLALVGSACMLDMDELTILDELETENVRFTDPAEEKAFLALFAGMSENSRKWTLCGWRPVDLIN